MDEHEAATGTRSSSLRPGPGGNSSLADRLSELARDLEHEQDLESTLGAIVEAAVVTVDGAQHASISAVSGGRVVHTLAATAELSRAVDRAQYETGQGPCLETLYTQETVRLDDLVGEPRWPAFVARARDLGVGSMLAVQLFVEGSDLGALNLTSEHPHAFGEEDEHVALLFASHAAVAMSGAQHEQQLHRALDSRDLIGQAKGILMERHKVTADQAFSLLVRASSTSNHKLLEVARELTTSGLLEGRPLGRG